MAPSPRSLLACTLSLLSALSLTMATPLQAKGSKPAVVIVPGAWQLPVVWDEFRSILDRAGYNAYHVALPSIGGTELPLTGLPEDVAAVRKTLDSLVDEGREVVMLCHSSGGVVGSNAIEGYDVAAREKAGKKGGVVRIVYLSAFMLPKGKSLIEMLGGEPLPWMVIEGDRVSGDPALFPEVGFNDMSPEDQARWSKEATYTSLALFTAQSQYEPWSNGIPGAYIFCTLDNALPYPLQQQMASQLGTDFLNATLESSHVPFLSMPDRLFGALTKVINA